MKEKNNLYAEGKNSVAFGADTKILVTALCSLPNIFYNPTLPHLKSCVFAVYNKCIFAGECEYKQTLPKEEWRAL